MHKEEFNNIPVYFEVIQENASQTAIQTYNSPEQLAVSLLLQVYFTKKVDFIPEEFRESVRGHYLYYVNNVVDYVQVLLYLQYMMNCCYRELSDGLKDKYNGQFGNTFTFTNDKECYEFINATENRTILECVHSIFLQDVESRSTAPTLAAACLNMSYSTEGAIREVSYSGHIFALESQPVCLTQPLSVTMSNCSIYAELGRDTAEELFNEIVKIYVKDKRSKLI